MAGSDPWEAILERIADGASLIGLDPDLLRLCVGTEPVDEIIAALAEALGP